MYAEAAKNPFQIGDFMRSEKKRISVSQKRQITIPLKYFEMLDIGNEVECFVDKDMLIIKPVRIESNAEFAQEILKELVEKGLGGNELLQEFQRITKKVRPAVQEMIDEADKAARNFRGTGDDQMSDIFGEE